MRDKKKLFIILVSLVVTVILFRIFAFVQVKTGEMVYCKFGELLRDNTRKVSVLRWLASDYKVTKSKSLCETHRKAEEIYAKAQKDLALERYNESLKKLNEVAKLDPDFQKTVAQIKGIQKEIIKRSGGAVVPVTPAAPATVTVPVATPTTPVVPTIPLPEQGGQSASIVIDLGYLIPGDITGYYTGELVVKSGYASRKFTSKDKMILEYVVISVYQMPNAKAAKDFADSMAAVLPDNGEVVPFGKSTGYFGTSGTHNAGFAWSSGNVAYELLGLSMQPQPEETKTEIIRLAGLLL